MGKHLIIDVECFDNVRMKSKSHVKTFLNKCVEKVNMRKLIEPIVMDGAGYNPGVTGFVVIETSHISIHTFLNTNRINMDLYSCRDFDETMIKHYLMYFFKKSRILNNHLVYREDMV